MTDEGAEDTAKILIVDDLEANRVALEAALADPDYRILLASSGEEALRILLRETCAVILMDVAMPGLDGFETARLIRKREKTRKIPIIFVTAFMAHGEQVFRGYEAGAVDYLVKPVDVHALRVKVRVFVDLFNQERTVTRTAEALRKAEHRERMLLESLYDVTFEEAPIGIGHARVNGPWIRVNARLAALLGRERGDILNDSPEDVVHPDDRAALTEHARAVIEGRERRHKGEYRLLHADGSVVWTALSFSLIRDMEGKPVQLAIVEDLSEEKRLSLELAASERRFARLRESGLIGIFHERRDGTIHEANEAFLRMLGYTEEDLADGRLRTSVFAGPLSGIEAAKARDDLRTEGFATAHELEFVRKDGSRGVMLTGAVADDGALGFALDVSAIREAEHARARTLRELEEGVRARDDFLAVASHELRTPLTPLLMQVTRLRAAARESRSPIEDHWLNGQLELVERYVRRLESLVATLIDVSELRLSGVRLERETTDLLLIARTIVTRMTSEIARAKCVIAIEARGPVTGEWDRLRLEQVVQNLLTNAVKFGAGHPIEVSIDLDDKEARLAIRDHGPGLVPESHDQIFERFGRLAAIEHHGGFGLGLWSAREIVRAHGGRIDVESVPGKGACFRVTLPRHVSAE